MDRRKFHRNNFKDDLLHWCAANNWPKEVQKRLEKGDSPYRANKDGLSPMHAAIAHDATLAVKILLECYASDVAIVKEHMQKRFMWKAENNCWKKRPILVACTEEECKQVALLASSCPSAIPFNVQVFVLLRSPTVDDVNRLVALDVCSAEKRTDVMRCINALLPNGVVSLDKTDLRSDCLTYLQTACLYDRAGMVALLVAHGSQLSATGEYESIPLMTAIRTMKMYIVKLLLTKYINRYDPTVQDSRQRNAFHIAVEQSNPQMVDYVLKALIAYRREQFGETESQAFNRIFTHRCEEYSFMTTWSLIRSHSKEQCSKYVVQYGLDLAYQNGENANVVELLTRKIALEYCFEGIRRNVDILNLGAHDGDNVLHHLFKHDHLEFVKELYEQNPSVKPIFETTAAFPILGITLRHRKVEMLRFILDHHKDYLRSEPAKLQEYATGQPWFDRSVYREPFTLLAAAFPEQQDVINQTIAEAIKRQQTKSFTDRFYALQKSFDDAMAALKAEGLPLEHVVDERNRNILHQAVDWDELQLIKNLLACGADLHQKDDEGNWPIFSVRSMDAFELLYDKMRIDPTVTNDHGYNLLHFASKVGSYSRQAILTKLLELGFDINQSTHDGNVPLSLANCCSTVSYLLKQGADVELVNGSALVQTLHGKQHCAAWALLPKIAHLSWFPEIAHAFLPWMLGNQNRDFFTCSCGRYLEQYPDIRKTLFDSLYNHSRTEAAEFFRKVCHRAINDAARWFLDYGYEIDFDVRDEYGCTPLLGMLVYMEEPNLDVIERLLQKGVTLKARDNWGRNPLIAIAHRFRSAQWYGHSLKTIELLLDHGVEINAQDDSGNTALHYAFEEMQLELAELLMARGADRKLKNNAQKLPYQMVRKSLLPLYAFLG
ncbi:uncharacterized protein LOC3289870 [Anopheles gambiae]|uniref:uncharacterized protein LOC3289870 n=1 Tax=Anopheles gambiae TaxID=7165 RepID=UPI002AC8B740|nr:uncharacterized protein LOC3289870 [Anopheles gambiae]